MKILRKRKRGEKKESISTERRRLLEKKLVAYSIAVGAVVLGAGTAEGVIDYSGLQNISITNTTTPIDLNSDTITDFWISHWATPSAGSLNVFPNNPLNLIAPYMYHYNIIGPNYSNLIVNVAALDFSSYPRLHSPSAFRMALFNTVSAGGPWFGLGSTDKNIGVIFEIGLNSHAGWIGLKADETGGKVTGWAHQTVPNTPIGMGHTPEPSSLALLAMGAAGLAWHRRRRKKKAG